MLFSCSLPAVIIDRIAVRVGNAIIKDSDIDRIVRVTEFLNDEPLNLSDKARRDAAKARGLALELHELGGRLPNGRPSSTGGARRTPH